MNREKLTLRPSVMALRRHYGKPAPPISRDPFWLILWEQVAYLVPDAQRRVAYKALEAQVGLTPEAIAVEPIAKLRAIARFGGWGSRWGSGRSASASPRNSCSSTAT